MRSAFTEGVREPASMRLMYAYETPGDETSRCDSPRAVRSRRNRSPIVSLPLVAINVSPSSARCDALAARKEMSVDPTPRLLPFHPALTSGGPGHAPKPMEPLPET